mmetsp:Transcript_88817/g.215372  ORF Transcript_88817/g.215372 Transcript_88817/m.215372 type:complete len:467 (+) Transcript_88817:59-1459(+)
MGACGSCWAGCGKRPRLLHGDVGERYELGKVLGAGALGVVYQARRCADPSDDVAVKRIPCAESTGFGLMRPEELYQLIRTTQECRHDNLIRTWEAFIGTSTLDVVMELASGGEVTATFEEVQGHSERTAQTILRQVCSGLAYLHAKGITHGAVIPENVIYADGARKVVKLADFGMGRAAAEVRAREPAAAAPFLAPELFKRTKGPCHRSGDMWAAGAFAFLVLFGILPFAPQGEVVADFENGVPEEWIFPANLQGDFSLSAKAFITACLQRDVAKRLRADAAAEHVWLQWQVSGCKMAHFECWQRNIRRWLEQRKAIRRRACLKLVEDESARTVELPSPGGPVDKVGQEAESNINSGSTTCREDAQTAAVTAITPPRVQPRLEFEAPQRTISPCRAKPSTMTLEMPKATSTTPSSTIGRRDTSPSVTLGAASPTPKNLEAQRLQFELKELEVMVQKLQRARVLNPE